MFASKPALCFLAIVSRSFDLFFTFAGSPPEAHPQEQHCYSVLPAFKPYFTRASPHQTNSLWSPWSHFTPARNAWIDTIKNAQVNVHARITTSQKNSFVLLTNDTRLCLPRPLRVRAGWKLVVRFVSTLLALFPRFTAEIGLKDLWDKLTSLDTCTPLGACFFLHP